MRAPVGAAALWLSLAGAAPFTPIAAQGRLVGYRTSTVGMMYEGWSFSDGISQPHQLATTTSSSIMPLNSLSH